MTEGFTYHANGDIYLLGDAGPGMTGNVSGDPGLQTETDAETLQIAAHPMVNAVIAGEHFLLSLLATDEDREEPWTDGIAVFVYDILHYRLNSHGERLTCLVAQIDDLSLAEIGLAQIGDVDERHSARTEGEDEHVAGEGERRRVVERSAVDEMQRVDVDGALARTVDAGVDPREG